VDARQTSQPFIKQPVALLLVRMYRYKGHHTRIALGEPLSEKPLPPKPVYRNILAEALKVSDYLSQNTQRSYLDASSHFRVSRARISQLMKIVNNISADLIIKIGQSTDQALLRRFSGKTLLKIVGMQNIEDRQDYIQNLLNTNKT
jgi:hypothetical protein